MEHLADPPFTSELRSATSSHHKASNRLVHLTAPLALSSQAVYASLLKSFYHIFESLEQELETRRRQHPKISGIYLPTILRTEAFKSDLSYHLHEPFKPSPLTPATKVYITEMSRAVENDPVLLVAYVHTLYAGLLAGGQVIRGWVMNAFGGGVNIFEFQDPERIRLEFKGAVDRLALSREEKDRIVKWKLRVFEANDRVLAEVRQSQLYRTRVVVVESVRLCIHVNCAFLRVSHVVEVPLPTSKCPL